MHARWAHARPSRLAARHSHPLIPSCGTYDTACATLRPDLAARAPRAARHPAVNACCSRRGCTTKQANFRSPLPSAHRYADPSPPPPPFQSSLPRLVPPRAPYLRPFFLTMKDAPMASALEAARKVPTARSDDASPSPPAAAAAAVRGGGGGMAGAVGPRAAASATDDGCRPARVYVTAAAAAAAFHTPQRAPLLGGARSPTRGDRSRPWMAWTTRRTRASWRPTCRRSPSSRRGWALRPPRCARRRAPSHRPRGPRRRI